MYQVKGYSFNIKIEEKELDVWYEKVMFSIKDSIHKLHPEGTLVFLDAFGVAQERAFLIDGTNIKIDYGFGDDNISCPFNVIHDQSIDMLSSTYIAGNINLLLKHNYHWTESIQSKVFKQKKISEVVTDLFSKYQFTKRNIFETMNKSDWYQPLMKESDFIYKILLPNAYSPSSNNTPYFCFINSNNEVNFTTYNQMFNRAKTIDIVLNPQDIKIAMNTNPLQLNRFITGNEISEPLSYVKDFEINSENGSLIEHDKRLIDYPKTFSSLSTYEAPKQVPIRVQDELYKSYIDLPSAITTGQKDNNNGKVIYNQANGFFLERLHLILPLNLKLIAGRVVNLNIDSSDKTKSIRFGGVWLIEESEHIFNGREGLSIIDISKKNIRIPNHYENSKNVWGRTH